MGLGTSIVVFAVGAVLAFAITVTESHGVNWNTVGDILMGVGAFGVLVSIWLWGAGPWGGVRRRSTVVDSTGRMVRREDVNAPL
ncbi:MAG: DUF6458 family protein [Acidimicrobiales bacterium]